MPEESETTNKVLETKIDGLKELTDTRFKNIESSLGRIENAQMNYALKTEVDEVKKDFAKTIKEIRDDFSQHNKDDKDSFGGIMKKLDFLTKITYLGIGGLGVIEIGIQLYSFFHK